MLVSQLSPLYQLIKRKYGEFEANQPSPSLGGMGPLAPPLDQRARLQPHSQKRNCALSESSAPTANLQTSRCASFVNLYNLPIIKRGSRTPQTEHEKQSMEPEFANHHLKNTPTLLGKEIASLVIALLTAKLEPKDLNSFLVEHLGKEAKFMVAANWNIISAIIYAPLYRMRFGNIDITQIRASNNLRAVPGAIIFVPIFHHLLDDKIQPDALDRVETAYGQQIVKERGFIVHSVHENDMYVIYETAFGDSQGTKFSVHSLQ
jgi:hypothetical protein